MKKASDIVITGLGVVSPLGLGLESFWESLINGRSGVVLTDRYSLDVMRESGLPWPAAGVVSNFDPKERVKPRKNIKVMTRDIQMGFVAADYAREQAELGEKPVASDRQGVLYGAPMIATELDDLTEFARKTAEYTEVPEKNIGEGLRTMQPLWMLKFLPNMPACHIGIAYDMQGPNNTLVSGDTATLSALIEASRVIQRSQADVMIAGGTACCTSGVCAIRYSYLPLSHHEENPATACRPYDATRDGVVMGEGAGACVLERREIAQQRGAKILARIVGYGESFEPVFPRNAELENPYRHANMFKGDAIRRVILASLKQSGLKPEDIGQVHAQGMGTVYEDSVESHAIHDILGNVPVTSIKGGTGNALSGSSAQEMVAGILSAVHGVIPPSINCMQVADDCPINVVIGSPIKTEKRTSLLLNYSFAGHAVAVIVEAEE